MDSCSKESGAHIISVLWGEIKNSKQKVAKETIRVLLFDMTAYKRHLIYGYLRLTTSGKQPASPYLGYGALLHVAWPRACALRGLQPDLIDKSGCFRRWRSDQGAFPLRLLRRLSSISSRLAVREKTNYQEYQGRCFSKSKGLTCSDHRTKIKTRNQEIGKGLSSE